MLKSKKLLRKFEKEGDISEEVEAGGGGGHTVESFVANREARGFLKIPNPPDLIGGS